MTEFKLNMSMITFILQIICSFLFAMSIIFVFVELRARFDKSFLVFGICNLLLCTFCAIDILVQYDTAHLTWTKLQHVIASFFVPFLAWHLFTIMHIENTKLLKTLFFIATLFSLTFFSNILLTGDTGGMETTLLYNITFVPYILAGIIGLLGLIIVNLRNADAGTRKLLTYHLIGSLVLSIFALLDLICIATGNPWLIPVASASVFGVLIYSLILTIVFTERLSMIIRQREITFKKLREAYKELEEVQSLKELGQSTAIINHEIKNYTCAISGYAEMLPPILKDDRSKRIVNRIIEGAKKITSFSQDILDFSKSRIIVDKAFINFTQLVQNCIFNNFLHKKDAFIFEYGFDSDVYINGDWNKLEQVFINIFKNAFEADADVITLKMHVKSCVLLLVVEDNGIGCEESQMDNIFKAFYTKKKEIHGTGLGLTIVRSVIESHGGHVSAYTKNIMGGDIHGLSFNIAFPIYNETGKKKTEEKDNVIFIKQDIKNLASVIKAFQNVSVNPHIMQTVKDIEDMDLFKRNTAIVASPASINQIRNRYGNRYKLHTLLESTRHGILVTNESEKNTLKMFSEAYVIDNLLKNPFLKEE